MSTPENLIRDLLATYERSLNTGEAGFAASCYSEDGVFMPTTLPTVTGADVADGYRRIFDAISLEVTFTIDELVVTSDEAAYALTRSNGTQTVVSTGDESAESNREDLPVPANQHWGLEDLPLHVQQTRVASQLRRDMR